MPRLTVLAGLALAAATAAPAIGYEVTSVPEGGALAGTVRFTGTPPRFARVAVARQPEVCGHAKEVEALVLGPDRGVQGSVILLEGVARGKKPADAAVLDTHACVFVPHVAAVMAGEQARVQNSDPVLHNTHGLAGTTPAFNLALPSRDQAIDITRRLTRPGVIRVVCEVHPHMAAWMVVHDSPYYAVTDERGAYRIDGIPPGRYRVTLWHEGFRPRGVDRDGRPRYDEPRTIRRDVRIAPRATATVDFELR